MGLDEVGDPQVVLGEVLDNVVVEGLELVLDLVVVVALRWGSTRWVTLRWPPGGAGRTGLTWPLPTISNSPHHLSPRSWRSAPRPGGRLPSRHSLPFSVATLPSPSRASLSAPR